MSDTVQESVCVTCGGFLEEGAQALSAAGWDINRWR